MLKTSTMRAIGGLLARQARSRVKEESVQANEVITLGPLLEEWVPGTSEHPIEHVAGEILSRYGIPYKCASPGHTHRGEPGWAPGEAPALWTPYHATDAEHALPFEKPTGAHDMYLTGEYALFTDGNIYKALMDTAYSPTEYPSAWELVDMTTYRLE